MQYKIYLMKVDDEGDEYELRSFVVTAEAMIEFLVSAPEEATPEYDLEEEVEEEPEPVPGKKPRGGSRKPRTCGNCGETGHNRKTCPNAQRPKVDETEFVDSDYKPKRGSTGVIDEDRYQLPGEKPWYYSEILDLLKDETPEADIYEDYRTRITDTQFREALEWAKSEII